MKQTKYLVEVEVKKNKFWYCGIKEGTNQIHFADGNEWDAWTVKEHSFNDYKKAYNEMQKLKRYYNKNHFTFENMKIHKVIIDLTN